MSDFCFFRIMLLIKVFTSWLNWGLVHLNCIDDLCLRRSRVSFLFSIKVHWIRIFRIGGLWVITAIVCLKDVREVNIRWNRNERKDSHHVVREPDHI